MLSFGLPKGSLEDATLKLFARAGFNITKGSRSYTPSWDDPDIDGRFVRAQEMSRYVEDGFFDCGLTGRDWVKENSSDVEIVADLVYSRASNRISKWVLAVPDASDIKSVKDLQGKKIATELVQVTKDFLASHEVQAEVEFSWGATEVKVPELVDAIVDLTETGSSLRANKLRIVDILMETNTVLIANKDAWANPEKRAKTLRLTYFKGDQNRRFRILINGETLATVDLPVHASKEDLYQVDYPLPVSLQNAEVLILKFEAEQDSVAGGLYGIRLISE